MRARTTAVIAAKDLRQRLRDRTLVLLAFVAPTAFAWLVSGALAQFTEFKPIIAVVDLDGRSQELIEALQGSVGVVPLESGDAARSAVSSGAAGAALVIPEGFVDVVARGGTPPINVIIDADQPVAAAVAQAIADGVAARIDAVRLAVVATLDVRDAFADDASIAAALRDLPRLISEATQTEQPITIDDRFAGSTGAPPESFYGASMLVFFVYFTARVGTRSLITERELGTMPRLVATPAPSWTIVVGKQLGSAAVSALSIVTVILATWILLGARWGSVAGVAVMSLAMILAATGIMSAATSFVRTTEQSAALTTGIAVLIAMVGGNFIPLGTAPEFLQSASTFTPNAWALAGYAELGFEGAGVADILPEAGVVAAMGLATGMLGWIRSRRFLRSIVS